MPSLEEAIAAFKAERDRRRGSKHPDKEDRRALYAKRGKVEGATWYDTQACYQTTIHDGADAIHLYSYTAAELDVALKLQTDVRTANPKSHSNMRKRKATRAAANASKRAKDVEIHGDDCDRERRMLNAVERAVCTPPLAFLVLMLPSRADALFRTNGMPEGQYITEQHKTTAKMHTASGARSYQFHKVTGYKGLVVFECEADGAMFVARGEDVDAVAPSDGRLTITRDKTTDEPLLGKRPGFAYLGTGEKAHVALRERLLAECQKVEDPEASDALPLYTMAQANAELCPNANVEERGIRGWIRHVCGGIAEGAVWKDLPEWMQCKPHIYMPIKGAKKVRNLPFGAPGDVVAYPEHKQFGKADLLYFTKASDYEECFKLQFKTAQRLSGQNGFKVPMYSADGKDDGARVESNTYRKGDNDFYVAVLPSEAAAGAKGEFHCWTFSEAKMLAKNYIGDGARSTFMVYKKSAPCAHKGTAHAWTVAKHRGFYRRETIWP
jgi:hypothetical protein